ncbi:MAG: hypothetical protein TR69_WS6001001155 [candidate division WS6 bacterium OLB20]|uniref:Uncharacterized protein n=1 Tax=candidate division WS6 bacterium OLB20 TaxID=1617426 RepID=A0A136LWW8_9BACT|nr:MAG: hypothetical protein TR69_WS6001001155 [candidate division WS6 bacterium OLB20]
MLYIAIDELETSFRCLPADLVTAGRNHNTFYIRYLPPKVQLAGYAVQEVNIGDNLAVIPPGEAAISGEFVFCKAVIARQADTLFFYHNLPEDSNLLLGFIPDLEYRGDTGHCAG